MQTSPNPAGNPETHATKARDHNRLTQGCLLRPSVPEYIEAEGNEQPVDVESANAHMQTSRGDRAKPPKVRQRHGSNIQGDETTLDN